MYTLEKNVHKHLLKDRKVNFFILLNFLIDAPNGIMYMAPPCFSLWSIAFQLLAKIVSCETVININFFNLKEDVSFNLCMAASSMHLLIQWSPSYTCISLAFPLTSREECCHLMH